MTRTTVLATFVLATAVAVSARPAPSARQPVQLASLPYAFDGWQGRDLPAFGADTIRLLGADQHINRAYVKESTAAGLYLAYYTEPRPGAGIHSPLHCLPGTGWEREATRTLPAGIPGMPGASVRAMLVRRDEQRAVVLYWYALNGRMVASELRAKAYSLADGWRYGRNDAALVRIVSPVTPGVSPEAAERSALALMHDVYDDIGAVLSGTRTGD